MNNNKIIFAFVTLLIIAQSCAPRIKSSLTDDINPSLSSDEAVYVLYDNLLIPENSDYVGQLKAGSTGFTTDCGYGSIMSAAKEEARKKGSNIIAIIKFKKPSMTNTCYRIKANLYRNENPKLITELQDKLAAKNMSHLPKDANYAVIHFYRPRYFPGSAIGYKVKVNDGKVIGKMKNGAQFTYKTTDYGETKIWSKDKEEYLSLDIQPGQEYFVKCTVRAGFPVAKPDMFTIENEIGREEYEEM